MSTEFGLAGMGWGMKEPPFTLGFQVAAGPDADAGEPPPGTRAVDLAALGGVLELTGVLSAEQRRLADEWLRRQESR